MFISKILYKAYLLGVKNKFIYINGYKLLLPYSHPLMFINRFYPLYDLFIGDLAKIIPSDQYVIDVGANVGDSILRMFSKNPSLTYFGFEPVSQFFDLAKINLSAANKINSKKINLNKISVGTSNVSSFSISNGTARKSDSPNGNSQVSLDDFTLNLDSRCGLIKVDTDGFDWDVLKSGHNLISNDLPFLFFEAQVDSDAHYQSYLEQIHFLFQLGYCFSIFDNLGNFICHCKDYLSVLNFLKLLKMAPVYPFKIPYFDFCASHETKFDEIVEIVEKFNATR